MMSSGGLGPRVTLDEIVELLPDAEEILTEAVEAKNPLGNGLTLHPRGREFYREARVLVTRAKETRDCNQSLDDGIEELRHAAGLCRVLAAPGAANISVKLANIVAARYKQCIEKCLPQFLYEVTDDRMATPLMDWLQMVLNSWPEALQPVLHASCNEEALCNWHSAQSDLRRKMSFHTEQIQASSILFDNDGVHYLAVGRCGDIADVLEKACVALSSGPQTTAKIKTLRHGLSAHFTPFPQLEPLSEAIEDFMTSPVCAQGSRLRVLVQEALRAREGLP